MKSARGGVEEWRTQVGEDDPAGGVGPTLTYILCAGYQYLTLCLKILILVGNIFILGFWRGNTVAGLIRWPVSGLL